MAHTRRRRLTVSLADPASATPRHTRPHGTQPNNVLGSYIWCMCRCRNERTFSRFPQTFMSHQTALWLRERS
jgi:hypothetical protein